MSLLSVDLLKLRSAASAGELSRRYRRLCKGYHPDLKAVGERPRYAHHMQVINEVYEETLTKFNILTFRKPASTNGHRPFIDVEVVNTPPPPPPPRRVKPAKPDVGFIKAEAARALGRGLAEMKDSGSFFDLKAASNEKEKASYLRALKHFELVWRLFSSISEGQDALYYQAITHCNLKNYEQALRLFIKYKKRFPDDSRNALFHFYSGLLNHRMGNYARAVADYACFLQGNPGRQYQHFLALVATFAEAASEQTTPAALPYG